MGVGGVLAGHGSCPCGWGGRLCVLVGGTSSCGCGALLGPGKTGRARCRVASLGCAWGLQVMGWWFFWCCCCWSGSCVGSCLVVVGVLFENCTVDASIFVFCVLFCCCEVFMGAWWMPWHQEPMKDVVACDKPRGVGERALIRGCPNGETRQSSWTVTVI